MAKISFKPPSGFRDFGLEETRARTKLIRLIEDSYRQFGFQQISTSVCENLTTLQGKGGGQENEHLIFKIMRRGDALEKAFAQADKTSLDTLADLGLRFELTLPLARYVSRFRNDLVFPFKAFNNGNVYRAERAQKGRYREFMQCDVDVVGCQSWGAELDVLQAILFVFRAAGIKKIELQINDRRLLDAAAKEIGLSPDEWASTLVSLDKLDKLGKDGVITELTSKGFAALVPAIEAKFFSESAGNLASWKDSAANEVSALDNISKGIAKFCEDSDYTVRFNPTMVRGQEYYTGTIFEIHHPDFTGSLGGGGRYDNLLEIFGGPKTPAFGGSIGFERLFSLYLENVGSEDDSNQSGIDVFFPVFSEHLRLDLQIRVNRLRMLGLTAEAFPDRAKLKQQFKYANQRGARFTVSIGPDEFSASLAKIKDMNSGEEMSTSLSDLETEILAKCRT